MVLVQRGKKGKKGKKDVGSWHDLALGSRATWDLPGGICPSQAYRVAQSDLPNIEVFGSRPRRIYLALRRSASDGCGRGMEG